MLNPSPQIAGPPGNFINRASWLLLLPLQEGLAKINTQFFVCVERQDPIVNCCGCCKVFLIREIRPFAHNYLGAMGSGNFLCVVLASTVDDDNLVGNPFDGTQSARQVVFLVQRNQTNGETTHHPPESLDSALVSHNRRSADLQQQEARRLYTRVGYFAWKLTRIKLLPMRNRAPSFNIAARTRSSSKNVPLVESMSFKWICVFRTSSKQ